VIIYRVVGDKIIISQAPKYITESLAKTEMYELGVIGAKHVPEELEPVPCVIGSTLNPTPYFIKNIGIGIK
jgi:hypothetical protein